MFSNPTIQSTFNQLNGNSFVLTHGFGMYHSFYYYVMDFLKGVHILNDEWKLITFKTFSFPVFMISVGNSLYMTGDKNVWKVDPDLNILINYNKTGGNPVFRGISYIPSNLLIYTGKKKLPTKSPLSASKSP